MVVILAKYCWNFETKDNKEHKKRLKTNDNLGEIKKRKTKKIQNIE
jgi:hypothetical protein